MGRRREVNNSRGGLSAGASEESWLQELKEQKMGEVVDSKLHFKAVFRVLQLGQSHDTGVVDKDVDLVVRLLKNGSRGGTHSAQGVLSISTSSIRPGSRILSRAVLALFRSRAVNNSLAPVKDRARAVSIPIPEEVPVMTITFPASFPSTPSSLII
jgi:hypothetical protein